MAGNGYKLVRNSFTGEETKTGVARNKVAYLIAPGVGDVSCIWRGGFHLEHCFGFASKAESLFVRCGVIRHPAHGLRVVAASDLGFSQPMICHGQEKKLDITLVVVVEGCGSLKFGHGTTPIPGTIESSTKRVMEVALLRVQSHCLPRQLDRQS